MANLPHITLDDIRKRTSNSSYTRGESYYRNDSIYDTIQRGNQIEGQCAASSQPQPYRVRAVLDSGGIAETSCTCLYEYGGDCKHLVALLLTYFYAPESFEEHKPVEDVLAERSKDELIALIRQMVEHAPELQAIIDRPVPGKQRQTAVDTTSMRKELHNVLRDYPEWGDQSAESIVNSIARTADDFAAQGDWQSASTIYRAILEECLSNIEYFYYDEEGYYGGAVDDVVIKLSECLPTLAEDDGERQIIFNALLNTYLADIEAGDIAADVPDTILRYARKPDLPAIRERIDEAKKKAQKRPYHEHSVEMYNAFLADLDILDGADPEEVLKRLRDEEMYSLLVGKLLEMKRLDEAIEVVEEHLSSPYERLAELPRLVAAGLDDDAVRLAKATLRRTNDERLMDWLLKRLKARGDTEDLFDWELRRMKADPDIDHYNELKAVAHQLHKWDATRPDLIRDLETGKRYDVLTLIYLKDEVWNDAWDMLAKTQTLKRIDLGHSLYSYAQLEMEVAEKSRRALPERALPIYINHAHARINDRKRDSYAEAAGYLSVVRELYRQIGNEDRWQKLITDIRTEFKRLPALQDELRKAKL
jgi:uncharacterized Zn finger protein